MRKIMVIAGALGFLGLGMGAAAAFPAAPQPQVPTVEKVAQGCGWGFHRGPWGGCRPNGPYWGGPYWGPRYCWWRAGPWGPVRVCR